MNTGDASLVRPARDADGPPVAALIAACFAEYEGCIYDASEFPELDAPASWYGPRGTRMWVAEDTGTAGGGILGCICATPHGDGSIELHKFYVSAARRGSSLAMQLVGRFFALGQDLSSHRAFLWTDTRFARAHRFYEKLGFIRTGATRPLHDVSNSTEFLYELAPIPPRGLDAP